ncbi:MAG TPA: hypothetical protein H9707_01370 [Candidatus Butyricicoccus avicola]|nr:hypothetical protein [Candidatus Butyricicoccus avicola]
MRMIDADMLADGLKLHRQSTDQKHETDRQWAVGYNAGLERALYSISYAPTLTQPNEPLSVLVNDEPDREYIDYICPRCKDIISQRRRGQRMETVYKCKFHDNCGQRVDWSDPQPYCRQPEGEEGA